MSRLAATLRRVAYEIAPPLMLLVHAQASKGSADFKTRQEAWAKLPPDDLEKLVALEWERARHLDDKLSKVTAALSVAITLGAAVLKSVADGLQASWHKDAVLLSLCIAMMLMLIAAIYGFNGLRPKARFGYGPDFALKVAADRQQSAPLFVEALAAFEIDNRVRANEASTAIDSLRNGVVLFAAAVLLSLFAPARSAPPSPVDAQAGIVQPLTQQNALLSELRDLLSRQKQPEPTSPRNEDPEGGLQPEHP